MVPASPVKSASAVNERLRPLGLTDESVPEAAEVSVSDENRMADVDVIRALLRVRGHGMEARGCDTRAREEREGRTTDSHARSADPP